MAKDVKYGTVDVPGVGDDEPVFILRARDFLSRDTITNYQLEAKAAGCDDDHIAAVEKSVQAFDQWREDHEEEVRLPDSPPLEMLPQS